MKKTKKKIVKKSAKSQKVAGVKKAKAMKTTSKMKRVTQKTRDLVDSQLKSWTPSLHKKLAHLNLHLGPGDLQLLGLRVLERARAISKSLALNPKVEIMDEK